MKDLVHDLPLSVDFEQREQVSVPAAVPVVEFKPHGGDRVNNEVDAGDPCLEPRRWIVLVNPVKKPLNRAGEQVGTTFQLGACRPYAPDGCFYWHKLQTCSSITPAIVDKSPVKG